MYVNYLKNPLKTFPFFLQNCIFFMTEICKYEAKTQKQKKNRTKFIWQLLFSIKLPFKWYPICNLFLVLKFF